MKGEVKIATDYTAIRVNLICITRDKCGVNALRHHQTANFVTAKFQFGL